MKSVPLRGRGAPNGSAPTPARQTARRRTGRALAPGRTATADGAVRPTRRDDIVAAAIRVIARDGLRACTVSALEAETGFARGHFTYHFRSKEEIINLAFASVASDWATTQMPAPVGGSPRAAIEYRVRAAVTWVVERPEYFRCLMCFRVEMMRDPASFPLAPRIRAQMIDFTAQLIRDGIAAGELRPPADPALEARLMFAAIDGLSLHAAMDPVFHPPDQLADHVWRIVADRLGVVDPPAS